MVVVAEDSFIDDAYTRPDDLMPQPESHKMIVVVAGLAQIEARVVEPVDTSPRCVLFGEKATASQLYHAVSHLSSEYSSPDSFNLVLMYKDKKYPLKFENEPIPSLDLEPSEIVHFANIGVNRISEITNGDAHKTEETSLHKSQIASNNQESGTSKPTKSCLMEIYPPDLPPTKSWNFLLSPSTTLRDLYESIIFVGASNPPETSISLYSPGLSPEDTDNVYRTTEFLTNLPSLERTLEQIDFDFNRSQQILVLQMMGDFSGLNLQLPPKSANKRRVRRAMLSTSSNRSKPSFNLPELSNDLFKQEESSPASPPKFDGALQRRKRVTETSVGIAYTDFVTRMKTDELVTQGQSEAQAKPEITYVGLVNQAMTCYLNSLLQALYMTPEFRNALYNWEFVDGSEKDKASNSIPYQLQKLFLNLQTSNKAAVETTSLTKSFGWDSTEAWQQHDIQELCRVMFDALEQKFKNTQQADLINRLYEGKMIDYVKCLECSTEKSREDTFLDIPLPVKPFGSNVAYNSVEEALRAFVQPETLDGTNQYFCETCNKKCDAHKGLKFSRFPYLLTLHLKRFDFDNNTFHRIKLNDRVSFPDVLNLNSFVPSDNQESPTGEEDAGVGVKCDDSSTTDSGGLDECSLNTNGINENGITSEPTSDHLNNHEQDDDEGIDMSNGPSTSSTEHSQEDTRHRSARGPYMYELFSIMIHSGSASGGHYYAYIKDFRTNEWLCFNDQNVSPITDDDIQKTYGGGPTRGYYSGAYSSSTNAYMLMYRQIDPERNRLPMEVDNFPKHIQDLLIKMKEYEEERRNYERSSQTYRIKIHVHHPTENTLKSKRLCSIYDETLSDLVEKCWKAFDLENIVDLDQCRLVTYDANSDTIESNFTDQDQETSVMLLQQTIPDMLLEIRKKGEKFEQYKPGGLGTKVFHIDCVKKEILDGPIYIRATRTQTLGEYKEQVGNILKIDPKTMMVALQQYPSGVRIVFNNDNQLAAEGFTSGNKVFVTSKIDNSQKEVASTCLLNLNEIADYLEAMICLDVELPDTSKEVLEDLNIVSLEKQRELRELKELQELKEQKDQKDAEKLEAQKKKVEVGEGSQQKDESRDQTSNWCPEAPACDNEEWQEQSNSEDSSLSDSDRTLVGNASEDDQSGLVIFDREWYPHSKSSKEDNWEMDQEEEMDYFFKATPYDKDDKKHLRVIVDKRTKFSTFRKHLEPFIGVPVESFKVLRQAIDSTEVDYTRLSSSLRIWDDGEKISIKLGRALRSNEFRVKVFRLQLENSSTPYYPLFESTISKDATVEAVKRQLLAELKRKLDQVIPFEKCRLRLKAYEIPSKVLLNDQKIKDVNFTPQCELFLQELWEEEPVTNSNQIVVMVKRVFRNKKVLGPIQEIVLEDRCCEELAKKISEYSKIELDNLQVTKGKWPCNLYDSRSYWTSVNVTRLGHQPWPIGNIEDGASIFFRDVSEKGSNTNEEMSPADFEAEDVRGKLTGGFRSTGRARVYNYAESPRREKALKIYLDDK